MTHHYLVDLVAGGSLAVICFYYFLPEGLRHLPSPHDEQPTHNHNGYIPTASEEEKGFELSSEEGWAEEDRGGVEYPPMPNYVPPVVPLSIKVNGRSY